MSAAATIAPPPSAIPTPHVGDTTPRSSETSDDVSTLKPAAQASWRKKRGLHLGRSNSDNSNTAKHEINRTASPKRSKTFWKSFKYLLDLTPKQVDDFMASYVIYSLDWADEEQMVKTLGPEYKAKIGDCLQSYYGVLNHLCALGDVEKMYIPPFMDKKASVLDNQMLYEESIARDIGLKPGDKVLDLGCGRGRVAAHMAAVSGAVVTGLNIDPNQVAQAREFTEQMGLQNSFTIQDMNELPLPFEDNSFDAFYQIQALSLCKDLTKLFSELRRVLKPGAKISLLDWVSLPAYDATNPEHAELMRRTKPLIGAVGTPTPATFEEALTAAGFTVLKSDNASIGGLQAPLIDKADVYFRSLRQVILGLVKVHLLPPHFKTLINRLCLDGQAFVKMDTMRLVTTSYRIIAQKQ
ncbi:methyltransferase domain-containing protein [Colletotrichum orchidophilum]|uniref:Methyltransferase domain-containing protein n=1 Tax=Colletotrichum orchidophilum TaxID=1209926 RepID=A0A1G4ATW7_9PEZI|nr:methyltransferase domain-containing protein [Colletotrichum orchidophilum]OHE92551.1 methyltransferase domain-containing protein [Colletotrichum orchidophilum]